MDGYTSPTAHRYSPIWDEPELPSTHQNSNPVSSRTLNRQINNSVPAQTLTHQINNSVPAQTLTHQINSLVPDQTLTHQINSSVPAQTLTHQINNSVPNQPMTNQNNLIPAQKLSSWKQLKELKDTRKLTAHDSLFLIQDDQRQIFPSDNRSIPAWQLEADGSHAGDRISNLRGQADGNAWHDSLDSSQTKEHDDSIRVDVKFVYNDDIANSRYNMHSTLSAHANNNISHNTATKSKFLEECQVKVSTWQSEMMNKSFCLDLNETSCKPKSDLQWNKARCQSHNDTHLKSTGCQSLSDLNLNKTSGPSHNDLHSNKSGRNAFKALQVNKTTCQSPNDLCNLSVETSSETKNSQFLCTGFVSANPKTPSLSSELLYFRQQRKQCKNSQQNTNTSASPLKQNAAANQNMINNMFNANVQNESMSTAEKNSKNNIPFICHGFEKNKYNSVRYKYVYDLDTHSDQFYFHSGTKNTSKNKSQCWDDTLSNISSLKTDVPETSMTPDSLITAKESPRTEQPVYDRPTRTTAWSNRPMIDLGCKVNLLTDGEFINSNLNAKECGDAPSGDKESSPLNHKTNRLLFLDYLLKSEEKSNEQTPLNVGFRKSRKNVKGKILTPRTKKNKDGCLKSILSVVQMKPMAKTNNSEKRKKYVTNVKDIVTDDCILPVDDNKSSSSASVKSEKTTSTISLYGSKHDNSDSSSTASLSLDSLQSCTSKESSEEISSDSSSLEQKLGLGSSKKYTNKRCSEIKPYDIGTVSNQYIKGCLFLNKVITDNFNLLQLSACNGKQQSSETDVSIESDYHEEEKDTLSDEELSQATSTESSNNESRDELLETHGTSKHTPENASVKCNDYIIGIMANTIISNRENIYMTPIFKSVNESPSIKLLDTDDNEEQSDVEISKEVNEGVLSLALRAEKPETSFVMGKVQDKLSEKSLEQISVLGKCHDSEVEKAINSSTRQASHRPLAPKHKGPFVCNPSMTAFPLHSCKYFGQKRRQYKCFSISKSRKGPSFKRFTNRPQHLTRVMPTAVLPLTTVTIQRTERSNTLGWHDQVNTCSSPKDKSNVTAFPARNSIRRGYRKTWIANSKRRKHTISTRGSHSKANEIASPDFVMVRNHCPSTGHILDNKKKVGAASKCSGLIVRNYRIGAKCKSLYTRNPRVVIARPVANSKKNTSCAIIESNQYSSNQTTGNVKPTTNTAKSRVLSTRGAGGQSEPLKNALYQSKCSAPRGVLLKPSDGMNEKCKNAFKQCDKLKASAKRCDSYPPKYEAPETNVRDTNRPAPNYSAGKSKPPTNTCKTVSFPEARRQDVTATSAAKIPNFNHAISSLKETSESRSVFSRLWVSHSKCIGDVSSICCQILSDIKQDSASYGFSEDDVKCLWILNKQFKSKVNSNQPQKVGTEVKRTRCSPRNKKHLEIDIISNYKGVISCIRAIITKQNISLRAIEDAILILESEESVANKSVTTVPLEQSKCFQISSKEKPKDSVLSHGNAQCSKNRGLQDRNKGVCFQDDLPRCPNVSAHRQQCNLRPEKFSGNCSKFKCTKQEKVKVPAEPASKTEQYNSCCTNFYRSPFTQCGAECMTRVSYVVDPAIDL